MWYSDYENWISYGLDLILRRNILYLFLRILSPLNTRTKLLDLTIFQASRIKKFESRW